MKTKAVYIITSTEKDYYLEQLVISVFSLKYHNPDIFISIVMDEETYKGLSGKRNLIKDLVSEINSILVPVEYSLIERSRYLKTNLRKLIKGDYLFIDTDTIITSDLRIVDDFQCSVGAVLDKHIPIQNHSGFHDIIDLSKKYGFTIRSDGEYFNSGIMYVKDNVEAHSLYESWHQNWKDGIHRFGKAIDQPALAKANEENNYIISELSGIFNCQIIENGLKYLYDAKIIHYFASNIGKWDCPYIFREKSLYEEVRNNGITKEIESLIQNAKSAFNKETLIIAGNMCKAHLSTLSGIARRIFIRRPRFNNFIDQVYRKIHK